MAMEGFLSPEMTDILTKVAVFMLVQALVYLILTKSSNVFSENSPMRSLSFKPMRSASVRRMLGYISDVPMDGYDTGGSPTYYSVTESQKPENHID
ncbi:transmembrane protein [Rhynchospora pubera]|uniref:Transmembrane protein n=1 Tax=Rhynchospora pubera TaxID=906938 RepID=A0AAV8HL81_9POAL|nr:transmembrane protein [Rhynchospora pubera]